MFFIIVCRHNKHFAILNKTINYLNEKEYFYLKVI